jgi:hypothetical protein
MSRTLSENQLRALNAYHDGELGSFSRWWWERQLEGSADLRAELDEIRALSNQLQQSAEGGPSVDLWDRIALSLPALDAQREAEADTEAAGNPLSSWFARPIFAAAATAALAVALVLGTIGDTPVTGSGVVRWLDTGGRNVIVLDEPGEATIVWLLEPPTEGAARGGSGESV